MKLKINDLVKTTQATIKKFESTKNKQAKVVKLDAGGDHPIVVKWLDSAQDRVRIFKEDELESLSIEWDEDENKV